MNLRTILLALALCGIATGATAFATPTHPVPTEVARAIAAFNALNTFQADGTLFSGESLHIEAQRPDRYRVDLGKGIRGVLMGHVVYVKAGSEAWHRAPAGIADRMQAKINMWQSIYELGLPDQYRWTDRGQTAEGHLYTAYRFGDGDNELWIRNGTIVKLQLALGDTVRFHDFNAPVSIEAPADVDN